METIALNVFAFTGAITLTALAWHLLFDALHWGTAVVRGYKYRRHVDVLAALWVAADALREASGPADRPSLAPAYRQVMDTIKALQHGARPST